MCWNEHVSLNTFLFSGFVLGLIIYNNAYTKYKIQELNNIWAYLFFASFIFMQLIEFFIWRNINNSFYNNVFSIIAVLLLIIQPVISLMNIANISLRNGLLLLYILLAVPYSIYKFTTQHIYSMKSEKGHLRWVFFDSTLPLWVIWLFFFFFSFIYQQQWYGLVFGLIALVVAFLNYKTDHTIGSVWCWSVNSAMIYFAAYLLFYLPFLEKKEIC